MHMQVELCVRAVVDSSHPLNSTVMGSQLEDEKREGRDEREEEGEGTEGEGANSMETASQDAVKSLTVYVSR